MARENYSYKKFQRELAQKKKREEKLKRKQDKKNLEGNTGLAAPDATGEVAAAGDTPATDSQPPSPDI